MVHVNHVLAAGSLIGLLAVAPHATPRPATPQPAISSGPLACFAVNGCPGMRAEICFAAVAAAPAKGPCPAIRGRIIFATTPRPRR